MGRGAHVGWGGAMSPHPYRQPPPGLCGPLFSKRWTGQVGLAGDAQLLRRLRPLAGPPRARSGAVGTTPRAGGAVRASSADGPRGALPSHYSARNCTCLEGNRKGAPSRDLQVVFLR